VQEHFQAISENLNEIMQFYGCQENYINMPQEQYLLSEYKLQQGEQIQIEYLNMVSNQ
jgi:hypothetical protein